MTEGLDRVANRLDGLPWSTVLLAGVVAFLVGYLLTVLVVVVGPSSISGNVGDALVLLVYVFYSAHNVPLAVGGLGRVDWLSQVASPQTPDPAVPVVVFYVIPVLVLLGTAILVTSRVVDRTEDPLRIAASVGCLTVSYALVAVAGTFVFTSRSVFGGPARLVLTDAAVFGIAYPLVFGTIGAGLTGMVAYVRTGRAAPD